MMTKKHLKAFKRKRLGMRLCLISPSAQQQVDQAIKLASGAVNLKSLFRTAGFAIFNCTFEQAQFSTRGDTTTGTLQGKWNL